MKKLGILFATVIMMMLFAMSASALDANGQCGDNVYWNFNESTGELVISGEGKMYDYDESPFYFCNDIKSVDIEKGVTNVGANTFSYCSGIENITFSDTVEYIGFEAFSYCKGLKCISLPDSVEVLGYWAFGFCTSLAEVDLGNGLTTIGNWAFDGCSSLESIIIPDTVTEIGSFAFKNCSSLKEITIPDGVRTIEEGCFSGCTMLSTVEIPKSVTLIKMFSFDYCENLQNVYYGGTEGAWKSIKFEEYNDVLKKTPVDFTEAEIEPPHEHTYTTKTIKATLTQNGSYKKCCEECGYVANEKIYYSPETIKLKTTKYTYDGKSKKPAVVVKDKKGKELKKDTDYKVTYESGRKEMGKYYVKITFKGNYSGSKKLYFSILPGKTSEITVNQQHVMIKLKWKEVKGADGYRVYQYNSKTEKYVAIKTTTKTDYIIDTLKPGTTYKFAVKAYAKVDGETLWAASSKSIKTCTKTVAPTVESTVNDDDITLKWNKVTGATGYVIYQKNKSGNYEKIGSTKNGSYTVKNLEKGKTYYFRVRGYKTVDGKNTYGDYTNLKVTIPYPAIYVTPSGKRYHYDKECAGKNATITTLANAQKSRTPCKTCVL